jgi:hypothetical protein
MTLLVVAVPLAWTCALSAEASAMGFEADTAVSDMMGGGTKGDDGSLRGQLVSVRDTRNKWDRSTGCAERRVVDICMGRLPSCIRAEAIVREPELRCYSGCPSSTVLRLGKMSARWDPSLPAGNPVVHHESGPPDNRRTVAGWTTRERDFSRANGGLCIARDTRRRSVQVIITAPAIIREREGGKSCCNIRGYLDSVGGSEARLVAAPRLGASRSFWSAFSARSELRILRSGS